MVVPQQLVQFFTGPLPTYSYLHLHKMPVCEGPFRCVDDVPLPDAGPCPSYLEVAIPACRTPGPQEVLGGTRSTGYTVCRNSVGTSGEWGMDFLSPAMLTYANQFNPKLLFLEAYHSRPRPTKHRWAQGLLHSRHHASGACLLEGPSG